ncbi:MAG: hypothetical protein J0H63_09345, partial [Rhizobiales bacterium]|nr:hypothetical protein [Hyphomicrobiales bacterium]
VAAFAAGSNAYDVVQVDYIFAKGYAKAGHLQPIEVARVVSFLLGDAAMLVRGQAVNADAGETPY